MISHHFSSNYPYHFGFKIGIFFEPDIWNLFDNYCTQNFGQTKCISLIISRQFANKHSFYDNLLVS